MKKIFLLAITIMVTSITFAQGISIGAKAGINYGATVTSDADYNDHFDPIIGPHFGVVADIALTDDFSVQPELLFSPSGSKLVDDIFFGTDAEVNIVTKANYLTIPIMAKYYFIDGLSLEAGPYASFLLSTKQSGTYGGEEIEVDEETLDDMYKSTDFGLGVGASYELEMGVFFTARYCMGLTDIENENDTEETKGGEYGTESFTIKNNIFQFSVGYKFM